MTTLSSGRVTGQDGEVKFAYVSGNSALDLTGTVESRSGDPVDVLATPDDLERWVTRCDELPDRITIDRTAFDSALALREALYGLALDRVHGRPFAPRDLETVNATAARPMLTVTLSDTGVRTSGDLPAVLSHLARSGIALLADSHACLKECGGAACTRLYLDRSRGARRTWCGMEECGNRVKAAAYRARRRASATAEERAARGNRLTRSLGTTSHQGSYAPVLSAVGLLLPSPSPTAEAHVVEEQG